jgi:hypothetical protein
MNCTTVQQRLLACERLGDPPTELRDHLSACPDCRAWQRKALALEDGIHALSVRPSTGPAAFVRELLTDHAIGPDGLPWWVQPHRRRVRRPRERLRQRVALAFALAAGLAIFALGWSAWRHGAPRPGQGISPDPAAVRLDLIHQKLDGTRTPNERVQRLADFAEELHRQAKETSADPGRVAELAQFYTEVIQDHLLPNAAAVPAAERAAVLGTIAERLRRTESDASRLKVLLGPTDVASAAGFGQIAAAAEHGIAQLTALARS